MKHLWRGCETSGLNILKPVLNLVVEQIASVWIAPSSPFPSKENL